jgi:hypothetical protein
LKIRPNFLLEWVNLDNIFTLRDFYMDSIAVLDLKHAKVGLEVWAMKKLML